MDARRYSRQIRLPEIGVEGQRRLCAAQVALRSGGFARVIEERYVRRAGMSVVESGGLDAGVDVAAAVATLGLRHGAARDVAEGALHALAAARAALEARR